MSPSFVKWEGKRIHFVELLGDSHQIRHATHTHGCLKHSETLFSVPGASLKICLNQRFKKMLHSRCLCVPSEAVQKNETWIDFNRGLMTLQVCPKCYPSVSLLWLFVMEMSHPCFSSQGKRVCERSHMWGSQQNSAKTWLQGRPQPLWSLDMALGGLKSPSDLEVPRYDLTYPLGLIGLLNRANEGRW